MLRGGPCPASEEYELAEIHFHWGKEDNRGSEHTINFKSYPMEVIRSCLTCIIVNFFTLNFTAAGAFMSHQEPPKI